MKLRSLLLLGSVAGACSPAAPSPAIAPIIVEPSPDAGRDGATAAAIQVEEPATPVATEPERSLAEKALLGWSRTSQCKDYDYFPKGGIRNFWCHRPTSVTIAALREAAGGTIFASGPHSADDLVLDVPNDFGRYDPAFVKWLADVAAQSKSTPETQAVYDRYAKPLGRIFWETLSKARSEKPCFDREKALYADLVAKKKLPADYYERWFYWMNPQFCSRPPKPGDNYLMTNGFDGGVSGNVTKTVIGFWIRRSIDGTMESFAQALESVLKVYDPYAMTAKPTPPTAPGPPKKPKVDRGY